MAVHAPRHLLRDNGSPHCVRSCACLCRRSATARGGGGFLALLPSRASLPSLRVRCLGPGLVGTERILGACRSFGNAGDAVMRQCLEASCMCGAAFGRGPLGSKAAFSRSRLCCSSGRFGALGAAGPVVGATGWAVEKRSQCRGDIQGQIGPVVHRVCHRLRPPPVRRARVYVCLRTAWRRESHRSRVFQYAAGPGQIR